MLPLRPPMRTPPMAPLTCLAFLLAAASGPAHGQSRISGAYIAREPTSAAMLQLTQGADGRITGVLSYVDLQPKGEIAAGQVPITDGTLDGNQLTLVFRGGGLFGSSLGGTLSQNTLKLQVMLAEGAARNWVLVRGAAEQFVAYSDDIRTRAGAIRVGEELGKRAQAMRETVVAANAWITKAELHSGRIPNVEPYFSELEGQMRSRLARARATTDLVLRNQIVVEIQQRDIAGDQADIQIDQLWDNEMGRAGGELRSWFATYTSECASNGREKLPGTPPAWESACRETVAAHAEFEPVWERIVERRAELRSIQTTAQGRRKSILKDSERIR